MQIKLLVFTGSSYPLAIGAASVRISEIIKKFSMDKDICNIKVISFNPGGKNVDFTNNWIKVSEKIEVFYVKYRLPSFLYRLPILNPLTLIEGLIAVLRIHDMDPDIIISSAPPPHTAILAYIYSKIFKKKYVVDIRDDWSEYSKELFDSFPILLKYPFKLLNYSFNSIYLLSVRHAALISCVHEVLKSKFGKMGKSPIIVVPNGINNEELLMIKEKFDKESVFKKNNIKFDDRTKFIIFAGTLSAHYYTPEIIFNSLKEMDLIEFDIKYIILGGGYQKEKIAQFAKKFGIIDHIYLLGKKSHSEVLELMLASDAAIYPLNKEAIQAKYAIGVKIYENIACGLPILAIINENSTVSQIIIDNNIGISLNWDEAIERDVLKKALLNILQNRTRYSQNVSKLYNNNLSKFDRATGMNLLHAEMSKIYKKM